MSSQPDFEAIAVRCVGMLAPSIYCRIYEIARSAGGLIVEVGTFRGAATVALALGLRDSRKPGRVISFDRGVSRSGVGDAEAFLGKVQRNLEFFKVDDLVELVVGDVSETAAVVPHDAEISVLMLDADGSIDRDIGLFFNRVIPGGMIIIDDCADIVKVKRVGFSTTKIDSKLRLAFLLLSYFKSKGIISEGTQIKHTYFGEKLRGCRDDKLDLKEILEVYRQLVFTSAETSPLQSARALSIELLKRISPRFTQRLRVLYRRHISKP